MKKNIILVIVLALVSTVWTGCTTFGEGTKRTVTVVSDTPHVVATLQTRSKKVQKTLPARFDLDTRKDRGAMSITATEQTTGRTITTDLRWVNADSAKMYGGAALGTVVFGVFGPASLITDLYTRSYKDVSDSMVTFDFLSSTPAVGFTPYPVTESPVIAPEPIPSSAPIQPVPSEPCPRLTKKSAPRYVWGAPDAPPRTQ